MKIERSKIKEYLDYLKETHHSESYINNVRNVLNKLIGREPTEIIHYFSPKSIRTAIGILNPFLKWMGAEPVKFNLGRLPQSIPDFLTKEELIDIWNRIAEIPNDIIRARDSVIFKVLLYPLGLRASEVVNLKWRDVKEDKIMVKGKGNKVRQIPIPPSLRKYLVQYRSLLKNNKEEDFVIQSLDGTPITRFELYRIVRKYAPRHHPHSFRHTSITHWLKNGMDLRTAREFSGHSSLVMLERYLHYIYSDENIRILEALVEDD